MSDLNTKLDRFTATILAEATADTERTLTELAAKRTAAYSSAEDQVLLEAYRYIHSEVERVKTEAGRQVSRHMLDCKRALFQRRDQIAGEVFGEVRERLSAYTAGSVYAERMKDLCVSVLAVLKGADQVRFYLRPADKALADTLSASLSGVKAEFLDGDFVLGGLIAEVPALGKRVDATFDTRLEDLSGHFAELFGLSLSGELDEEVRA